MAATPLCCCSVTVDIDNIYPNQGGCVPVKLFTDTKISCNFMFSHVTQESFFFLIFLQPLKHVEPILSPWAMQKQAIVQMGPGALVC